MSEDAKGIYYGPGNVGAASIFNPNATYRNIAFLERNDVREANEAAKKVEAQAKREKEEAEKFQKDLAQLSPDKIHPADVQPYIEKRNNILSRQAASYNLTGPDRQKEQMGVTNDHTQTVGWLEASRGSARELSARVALLKEKDIDAASLQKEIARVNAIPDAFQRYEEAQKITPEQFIDLNKIEKEAFAGINAASKVSNETLGKDGRIHTETTTSFTPEQIELKRQNLLKNEKYLARTARDYESLPEEEKSKYPNAAAYAEQDAYVRAVNDSYIEIEKQAKLDNVARAAAFRNKEKSGGSGEDKETIVNDRYELLKRMVNGDEEALGHLVTKSFNGLKIASVKYIQPTDLPTQFKSGSFSDANLNKRFAMITLVDPKGKKKIARAVKVDLDDPNVFAQFNTMLNETKYSVVKPEEIEKKLQAEKGNKPAPKKKAVLDDDDEPAASSTKPKAILD